MNNLDTTWVSTEDSFGALAESWNRLAASTDPTSIFLQHAWFSAAWQWRRANASLAILCVRRGDAVVGILPMLIEKRSRYGMQQTYLSSLDLPDAQQFGVLCAAEDAEQVATTMCAELRRVQCDTVQLVKLHETAANAALLKALTALPRTDIATADACLCANLSDTWEVYYARRSRRLKKGNNLIANRLKAGFKTVAVDRVALDSSAQGKQALDELLALSLASWKRDLATALHRPEPRAWIESLRNSLGDSGALCVWSLRLDGVLTAAELQLDYAGIVSALRADTAEKYDEHGVGTYLGWKVLENLAGKRHTLYNMGPGLNEYKERWADQRQNLTTISHYRSTFIGSLIWIADYRLRPIARKLAAKFSRGKPS